MKKIFLLGITIIFIFNSVLLVASNIELSGNITSEQKQWLKNHPGELPHWMTPEEELRRDEIGKDFTPTDPPPAPVRQPAEFEPMQGVLIRYPFGISYDIIAEMSEDTEVVTVVSSTSQQNYVLSQYNSHGVNTANCSFLIAQTDTYWIRDYGPWFIFNGNDEQAITDFPYNRPRPYDDNIPVVFGNVNNIPVYGMDITHTGGNYMTDGQGIAISTTLVWEENPGLTHQEIDQLVYDFLGIHTYHVVPDVNATYIKHIDCWAKYLSVDKIMIREVPPTHPQYDEIEAAVDYFSNQISSYGKPYEVVRVYTPNDEPYTNSLILNNKVLVPITGSSWDDEAIASYQEAMPGYEVIGFYGSWYSTDALHCRTMGITDRYMLYVHHIPLKDTDNTTDDYLVGTKIIPYSGENLIADSLLVYWRIDGSFWSSIQLQSAEDDSFYAYIPAQPIGTTIEYYIHAADNSGRSENHPYIGAPDPHTFSIIGGTIEGNVTLNGGTGNVENVQVSANGITVNPDDNGNYVIEIMSGTYDVTASLEGYQDSTITNVEVLLGQATTGIDFTLLPETSAVQDIPLYSEWNWISTYVHPDDTSLDSVFACLMPDAVYQVKSQSQSATNFGGVWIGDLTNISDGEGYLIYMNEQVSDFSIIGTQIPYDTPIDLTAVWNWIAFYPDVAVPIEIALQNITDDENAIQIKNQTQSATWFGQWIGDLNIMEPGISYKLNMNSEDQLIYQIDKSKFYCK